MSSTKQDSPHAGSAQTGPAGDIIYDWNVSRPRPPPAHAFDFNDETLLDTCLDVVNYSVMLYLCEAGKWPGWPHS